MAGTGLSALVVAKQNANSGNSQSSKSAATLRAAVSSLKKKAVAGKVVTTADQKILKQNKLKAAALALKITGSMIPWGDFSLLTNEATDISTLTNTQLKRHLAARNEVAEGTKQELIRRLRSSIEEEHQRKIAVELELEEKHRRIADLEEQGAVYVAGKNNSGQLGLGSDTDDCREFTVIQCTRGKRFCHVSTGGGITMATTERHEVYVWGGPSTFAINDNQLPLYRTPQLIEKLNGEEIVVTSIGARHACASSLGGDLFLWGRTGGTSKNEKNTPQPHLENTIGGGRGVSAVDCGEMHTCVRTKEDEVYAWGHCANGRLGFQSDDGYQSIPRLVTLPSPSAAVRLIACGSEHTLLCTRSAVYSFGCGDGGRLGQGDCSDRYEPCEITPLRGSHVLSTSAGIWHSACVVHVAPLLNKSGLLYTWGSGFQGQLGLSQTCRALTPTLVEDFINEGLSVREIFCGSHHNAAITHDGNLYTWGLNRHGALSRSIGDSSVPFSPHPGIVAGFGTIVNRIGRGFPMSVACGREYTIVVTYPYNGPSEDEALQIAEEQRIRELEERKIQELLQCARKEELKQQREAEAEKEKIRFLTSRRLCSMDPNCPGFTYETTQPSMCRECGFSVVYHTIIGDKTDELGEGNM